MNVLCLKCHRPFYNILLHAIIAKGDGIYTPHIGCSEGGDHNFPISGTVPVTGIASPEEE